MLSEHDYYWNTLYSFTSGSRSWFPESLPLRNIPGPLVSPHLLSLIDILRISNNDLRFGTLPPLNYLRAVTMPGQQNGDQNVDANAGPVNKAQPAPAAVLTAAQQLHFNSSARATLEAQHTEIQTVKRDSKTLETKLLTELAKVDAVATAAMDQANDYMDEMPSSIDALTGTFARRTELEALRTDMASRLPVLLDNFRSEYSRLQQTVSTLPANFVTTFKKMEKQVSILSAKPPTATVTTQTDGPSVA